MNTTKKFSEHLRDYGVNWLFYMVALRNLKWILGRGVLCRIRAEEWQHQTGHRFEDISDHDVQRHRWDVHRYVPLFFVDNTPMLYNACNARHDVVLLEISTEAANCHGVRFSDGNAASSGTTIYEDTGDLEKLDWAIVLSPNPATATDRHGRNWVRIRHSEVLIPRNCPAKHIQGVYFQSRLPENLRAELQETLHNAPHEIFLKPSLAPGGIPGGNKKSPNRIRS